MIEYPISKIDNFFKVMITGNRGFLGSWITNWLLNSKVPTIGISRSKLEISSPLYSHFQYDLSSDELPKFEKTDLIIHCAALSDVTQSNKNPLSAVKNSVQTTINALELARKFDANFLYISSARIYGQPADLPITEKFYPDPVEMYGGSKLAGEYYTKVYTNLYGLKTCVLRPFSIYGEGRVYKPNTSSGVIPIFVHKALNDMDLTIMGNGEQTKDFIHVADVIKSISQLFESKYWNFDIFNIATGQPTSMNELANLILSLSKTKSKVVNIEGSKESVSNFASIDKAKSLLGFEPSISLKDGLRRYIKWMGNQ